MATVINRNIAFVEAIIFAMDVNNPRDLKHNFNLNYPESFGKTKRYKKDK